MCHTTVAIYPKWAICGKKVEVLERDWLKEISGELLKSHVDVVNYLSSMHLFPFSSSSVLKAPATRLSQNLQHLSLLRSLDSATLTVSEPLDHPRLEEEGVTNHVSSAF
jgi:hypothetical protein